MFRDDQSTFGTQLKAIEADCRDLKSELPDQLGKIRNDLINTLENQRSSDLQASSGLGYSLSQIKQQLQAVQSMLTEIPLQHRILRHLIPNDINEMHSRRNHIIDADPDTCRWILEDGENYLETSDRDSESNDGSSLLSDSDVGSDAASDSSGWVSSVEDQDWEAELQHRYETRSRFTNWLATGQDILHVSGNAGSGKSTLMKFIAQHERTRQELEAWAGTKQLIFGQFYFWAAGTESQKSIQGLYRSLLFQALSQCPEVIEKVFPDQVARVRISRAQADPAVERVQSFDDAQVRDAFELLLKQAHDADYRMCFLLDGLDELKGNRLEHKSLALELKSWTLDGTLKLLVSSRPWPEFENVFVANATIYLHQLNHFDIRTYCIERTKQYREFDSSDDRDEVLAIEDIVDTIANQSRGIFLWTRLVLENILQGIDQGDSITTLKAKIDEYPADLDSLYDKLREPIQKSLINSNRANRMLLLVIKAPPMFLLPAIAFSWILDDSNTGLLDPEFPTDNECQPYSEAEATKRIQRVTKQINGLTRGLLEVDQSQNYKGDITALPLNAYFMSPGVRFCHRSAYDYLVSNEARYKKVCDSWPTFDDTDVYGRIHLARLLYGAFLGDRTVNFNRYLDCEWRVPGLCCRDFDPKTIRKFEAPLRPLLRGRFRGHVEDSYFARLSAPSFIQWCAFCGLDTFVLSVINEPPEHLHSVGSSILLAMVSGLGSVALNRTPTILQLLDRRIGVDVMVEKWVDKGISIALPAWVVMFSLILDIHGWDRIAVLQKIMEPLRCLQEYGEEVGERMSLTLGLLDLEKGSIRAERQFSSAEIVEWAEGKCVEERKMVAKSSTTDQAQYSWSARTANSTPSTGDTLQHTLGKWLKEYTSSYYTIEVFALHWEQIDVPNLRNAGLRVF